jgi:hypothetical protein
MAEDLESATEHMDRLLADMRRVLADVHTGGPPGTDDEEESLRGEGSAADGMVRVSAAPGGRLESLTVDPRMLRQGLETLCEQIVTAANAALEDLHAKATTTRAPDADLSALSTRLADLQDRSVRQMALVGQTLNEVVARIRGGR